MIINFLRLIRRCFSLARPYGLGKMLIVFGLLLINGIMQVVGIASIFPFFTFIADPDQVRKSRMGAWIFEHFPGMDHSALVMYSGVGAVLLLFLANGFALAGEVGRVRYSYGLGHFLRMQMLQSFALREYVYFLSENSGSMLNKLIGDVASFTQSVLQPVLEILSRFVVVILLLIAIFSIHPFIALGSGIFLGGFYFIIFALLRKRSRMVGEGLNIANRGIHVLAMQFIQGIKPITIHGKAQYFINGFSHHSNSQAVFNARLPIYGSGPRYLIEPIAFGGLVIIIMVLTIQGRSFNSILPNLAVIALAGYRILPSFQALYGLLSHVYAMRYVVSEVESEIAKFHAPISETLALSIPSKPFQFEKEIRLEKISFRYPNARKYVLKDFSLTIRKNQTVGIKGVSGSGKSTLIDIILGLHVPQRGNVIVDGRVVDSSNMCGWRSLIGYVPQDIYLLDASVAENIAFGISPGEIIHDDLLQAAEAAQIKDFIEKELSNSWNTIVGERGVRLSGGQKQRIGLARALYHRPKILILDEATSALDTKTEKAVMQTIQSLQSTMTMLIVAHRLSTLASCDRVIRFR